MPYPIQQETKPAYNPRWFIWTIVFLVITGISLVSYIVFSGTEEYEIQAPVITHKTGR